jgi:tetratricopeptide (TPR) repeat protein
MRNGRLHKLVHAGLVCALLASPARAAIDIEWGEVLDPRLREAIYDLNEADYFSGIVRLVTNRNYLNVGLDHDTTNLLLSALYLAYDMPDAAKDLLSDELDRNARTDVQNRLWLELAKTLYHRGQFPDAGTALAQIRGKLPKETEIERRLLYALVLIQQGQAKKAAEVLNVIDLKGNNGSTAFVRYNLAVALIKINQIPEALAQLKTIAELDAAQQDLLALKDQALIAAGYTLLRNKDAVQAKNYLEQVRIDGTLNGRALLGLGWAYTTMDKHKPAIAAWMELEKRDLSDPAALEATLAIPFAYSKLHAYRQAIEKYDAAITRFLAAGKKIEGLIDAVKSGTTMEVILRQGPMLHANAMQDYRRVTDAAELNFLAPLLMSHEFQQAHRNYEDMQALGKKVQQWITALERAKNVSPSFRESYMGRLTKHQAEISNTIRDIEKYIRRLVLAHLNAQRDRMNNYVAQARFATAQLYDQAARTGSN